MFPCLHRSIRLVLAVCLAFATVLAARSAETRELDPSLPAVFTNVQDVLDLGPTLSRRLKREARLRGVLTAVGRNPNSVIVDDGRAGILVYLTNWPADVVFGKEAEVLGITESALHAPMILNADLRILGPGKPPEPKRIPVALMLAGEGCWQYVRVEGVVRDMNRDSRNLALSIASEGKRFVVQLSNYRQYGRAGLPLEWLEARVSVDGICWTQVNDRSQPTGFHLMTYDTNLIRLNRPGLTNIFALPPLAENEAARLRLPTDDRLRLPATVVARFPDERVFLETAFGPVEARLDQFISRGLPHTQLVHWQLPPPLSPGDHIEMVGAPAANTFAPLLLDMNYRRLTNGPPPEPMPVTVSEMAEGRHDARLVRFTARLLAQERRDTEAGLVDALVVEEDDTVFEVLWARRSIADTNTLSQWPLDARLEVTGLCSVQATPTELRRTFAVHLRSPADVRYVGQPPFWMLWPVRRIAWGLLAAILAGGVWIFFLRRQVSQRTAALRVANEQLHDNAERLRASEQEVQRALVQERELGQLKSQFVSTVSHEFRTPLGVIMSSAENLKDYHDRLKPAQRNEHLDDIINASRTMSGLMEEVLLLGRVESGKVTFRPGPLELRAFCERVIEDVQSATNQRCPIELHLAPADRPARGDEGLLRHILVNLLNNAVKYSPAGRAVELRVTPDEAFAIATIRDHGIGIPSEDLPHLFEPFHRGRNVGDIPGSGLGMVIVKRCVDMHGGTIACESRVNECTTFTVRLPLFPRL